MARGEDLPVGWGRLHRDAISLAAAVAGAGASVQGIVAVARGGLVPAAILARELGIRLVDCLAIASYDDRARGQPRVLKGVEGDGAGLLVVDDLADSGATAELVRRLLPRARIATVYAKPAGVASVDHYVTLVPQNTWILFPWDLPAPLQGGETVQRPPGT